mmetsp:Transcript_77611/g.153967  ORF Transcript_77611/g.153967 Transcript_77611/m.153967 type:complete len:313 (+) Transcript_77611:46-984(+)
MAVVSAPAVRLPALGARNVMVRATPANPAVEPVKSGQQRFVHDCTAVSVDSPPASSRGSPVELCVSTPNLLKVRPDICRFPTPIRSALHFLAVAELPEDVVDADSQTPTLLRPLAVHDKRMTVVLDLDETLVHCRLEQLPFRRHSFCVNFEETKATGYVFERPFARLFLEITSRLFEVVTFTASSQSYADQVLNQLDPDQSRISMRLYRQHCTEVGGGFLKDMRRLGRSLDRVVLVDNSPVSLTLCPDNGVIVSSWTAEADGDKELMDLLLLLQQCSQHASSREFLSQRYSIRAFLEELRSQPELLGFEGCS